MLPFTGGISATANGLLVFSVLSSSLFFFIVRQPSSVKRALVKALSIFLLALITIELDGPKLLYGALFFATLGDYFLAFDGERHFKIGLGGFLLGQIAYTILFIDKFDGGLLLLTDQPWRIIVLILMVGHSWYLARKLLRILPPSMGIPIAVYAVVITTMSVSALCCAPVIVVLGALLFVFSDTLIAYERFILNVEVNQHPWMSHAIWITYYLAQVIIMLGVLGAI